MNNIYEQARSRFKPGIVKVLFVGESRPANGRFFYHENSNLYDYTREAFMKALGPESGKDFLQFFKLKGCYLDDLYPTPINDIKLKDVRKQRRKEGVAPLAVRMKTYEPHAIISVMRGKESIEPDVLEARNLADLSSVQFYSLPFPAQGHQRCYVAELTNILLLDLKHLFRHE